MAQLLKGDVQQSAEGFDLWAESFGKLLDDKQSSSPELGQAVHHATELRLALDRLADSSPESEPA